MRKQASCSFMGVALVVVGALTALPVGAQTLEPPYDLHYSIFDLGPVPGLPAPNGGLAFLIGDANTLLVGGEANTTSGKLYRIGVQRDAQNRIVGFVGNAEIFADAEANDGGVVYGPGNVLFLARWPNNELGQIMPGSTVTDKVVDLGALGVAESPGGLAFVPTGFPGAGSFKLASWGDGGWYTLELAPDGSGTYDVMSANWETAIPGGPEGFVYINPGSPGFRDFSSVLVTDWSEDSISVYDVDFNGDPIPGSRALFMTGVSGPEGATIDPLTGDLLFSFFTAQREEILVVRGFAPPQDDPGTVCEENPDPRGQGYWLRQCKGVPQHQGGLRRPGPGPKRPNEPNFANDVMPCADAALAQLGFDGVSVCDGLDASPPNDRCEQALKQLSALVSNVCSDRVQRSCAIDVRAEGCRSQTVGELLNEAAEMIHGGFCRQAASCAAAVSEDRLGLIDAPSLQRDGVTSIEDDRPRGDAAARRPQPSGRD